MEVSSATSVGRIRPLNEDSYFVSEPDQSGTVLAIVADGMGGHNAGEVASGKAVGIVQKDVLGKCGKNAKDVLVKAVNDANREIYEMSVNARNLSGMGTTMTACVAEEHNVTAVQVGDSRLYLIRGEKITQITKDHSLVEMLLENGKITKEEARRHPQKNIITRAVGTDKTVEADIYEFRAEAGDVILLCSDGLVNMVEDEEILSVINLSETLNDAANKLVAEAETAGGTDNITVILIRF
ncbi:MULTISPECIES: Stp1/IreP family PP2C-type Ser/Thr phosphatase [Congzhengia]|jgi:serine/threonine protein phosphatase PrpC|uniref:Stp1/IreP family PP2C-type Ser/Thr phosphatase n=1 Tax=Congzhengia minquanensis TaxID=2763657 RepID=A0A926I040_9FIRM|nr:Stp1/IreP family PP2C-type Ser/Thr phosphatase [Congzhengia minquanensis]MBC8541521.1 Stp1/IreP family PP2C-type Ser/Thr phosphatase [Congzhengia minquanensis]MBD8947336.1 Stp1/IreP family PP2C-type Ser/Thr phosphatase [Clostridiales bacterium]HBL81552.1 Stp1/IreP family PP2C-type Ser/Thr phosphatase [Clostridiales bacterium]